MCLEQDDKGFIVTEYLDQTIVIIYIVTYRYSNFRILANLNDVGTNIFVMF